MRFKTALFSQYWFFLLVLILSACSKNNTEIDQVEESVTYVPITIYGLHDEEHTLAHISENGEVETTNLNAELQLNDRPYYSRRRNDDMLLFYSVFDPNLAIKQKNMKTGGTRIVGQFCPPAENESLHDFGGNDNLVYKLANYEVQGVNTFYLGVHNALVQSPCSNIVLSTSDSRADNPIDFQSYGDFVLVYFEKDQGSFSEYFLSVIDLNSSQVVHEFVYEYAVQRAFIENNELLIAADRNNPREFSVYSMADFSFKRKISFWQDPRTPILFHPNIFQNKVVSNVWLPQPSSFPVAPRVADFETGNTLYEMTVEDLMDLDSKVLRNIFPNLRTEPDYARSFQDFKIDLKTETIVFSYPTSDSTGYVVFTDYDGNIKSHVEVPVNPQLIVIH